MIDRDALKDHGDLQEEVISELVTHIKNLEPVSLENIDALEYKLDRSTEEVNFEEIQSEIEKNNFEKAILFCYLEINRIKEEHTGDFIKIQDLTKLGNLIAKSLFEWYMEVDGFRKTVALSTESDNPHTPLKQYVQPSIELLDIILELDPNAINNQFLYAKLLFESFKLEQVEIDNVENAYQNVIETAKRDYEITNEEDNQLLYQSHLQLARVFSYASLQNKDLYEPVFTHYNKAYRYGLRNDLDTSEIFDNLEKLSRLINGQYPLYALIYSDSGNLLYQYIFEEIKFAPIRDSVGFNLSSLFAARESALQEIFNIKTNQSILEAEDYVIVQNTLTQTETKNDSIYLMLVFANVNKKRTLRELANFYDPIIQEIIGSMLKRDEINKYFSEFAGLIDEDVNHGIDEIITGITEWIGKFTDSVDIIQGQDEINQFDQFTKYD